MTIKRTLVLGLGNTILGDDGVGITIVREIRKRWRDRPSVEIVEASLGGLVLLDLIHGFDRVIVIDAIMTEDDRPAGFVYRLSLEDLGGIVQPYASHALDVRSTIELGKTLGYTMPSMVEIHAIKIEENTIFREGLTAPVEEAVPGVAATVLKELEDMERPAERSA